MFQGNNVTKSFAIMQQSTTAVPTPPPTAWCSFILSELMLAGTLFASVHKTLATLHTATKDITSMSPADKQLMITICENQVPLKWRQLWAGPKLVTDFIKAFVRRGVAAENRYSEERALDFGEHIDLASVFSVDSLLAALKLTNARCA